MQEFTIAQQIVIYKLTEFTLRENSIIFCHTDFVKNLFSDIRNEKINNITLITNQTDDLIDLKLYNKKPKCVKNWYSINVGTEEKYVKSIPLGLSNNHSPKNLRYSHFNSLTNFTNKKELKMYINFRITNFSERENLYEQFKNYDWVVLKEPNISLDEYVYDLANYNFILAPWGNGIDTHRIWEALYAGSIPITKYHKSLVSFKDLPILFVNDYSEINLDLLKNYLQNIDLQSFSNTKLNLDFWTNYIKKSPIKNNHYRLSTIKENIFSNKYYDINRSLKNNLLSNYKKYFIFIKLKRLISY